MHTALRQISWIAIGAKLRRGVRRKTSRFFTVTTFGARKNIKQSQVSWHITILTRQAVAYAGLSPSRTSASGAKRCQTARQSKCEVPDGNHPRRVQVRPHVSFNPGSTIRRVRGGPSDCSCQFIFCRNSLCQSRADGGRFRPHYQRMRWKLNGAEPWFDFLNFTCFSMVVIGALRKKAFRNHQSKLVVDKRHYLQPHRNEVKIRMRSETTLIRNPERQSCQSHPHPRLPFANFEGGARTRHFSRESSEKVSVTFLRNYHL